MTDYDMDELTPAEQELLAALPREKSASDLLEQRVVNALKNHGHLGGRVVAQKRGIAAAWRIAAAIALFAGGVATGRSMIVPAATQSAAVAAPSRITPRDTIPTNRRSLPVKGELIVAETELWL